MSPGAFVVDDHHHALRRLRPVLRECGGGGATLLHFDSHPDLAVPPRLVTPGLRDQEVVARCTVATWILPLVLEGTVRTVVWVAPPWSRQMDPGTFELVIGRRSSTQGSSWAAVGLAPPPAEEVAADDDDKKGEPDAEPPRDYYLSNGDWTDDPAADLQADTVRQWTLHVVRGGDTPRPPPPPAPPGPWVLDVDEDYLVCWNPFRTTIEGRLGPAAWRTFAAFFSPTVDFQRHHACAGEFLRQGLWRRRGALPWDHPVLRELVRELRVSRLTVRRFALLTPRLLRSFTQLYLRTAGECVGLPHHPHLRGLRSRLAGMIASCVTHTGRVANANRRRVAARHRARAGGHHRGAVPARRVRPSRPHQDRARRGAAGAGGGVTRFFFVAWYRLSSRVGGASPAIGADSGGAAGGIAAPVG